MAHNVAMTFRAGKRPLLFVSLWIILLGCHGNINPRTLLSVRAGSEQGIPPPPNRIRPPPLPPKLSQLSDVKRKFDKKQHNEQGGDRNSTPLPPREPKERQTIPDPPMSTFRPQPIRRGAQIRAYTASSTNKMDEESTDSTPSTGMEKASEREESNVLRMHERLLREGQGFNNDEKLGFSNSKPSTRTQHKIDATTAKTPKTTESATAMLASPANTEAEVLEMYEKLLNDNENGNVDYGQTDQYATTTTPTSQVQTRNLPMRDNMHATPSENVAQSPSDTYLEQPEQSFFTTESERQTQEHRIWRYQVEVDNNMHPTSSENMVQSAREACLEQPGHHFITSKSKKQTQEDRAWGVLHSFLTAENESTERQTKSTGPSSATNSCIPFLNDGVAFRSDITNPIQLFLFDFEPRPKSELTDKELSKREASTESPISKTEMGAAQGKPLDRVPMKNSKRVPVVVKKRVVHSKKIPRQTILSSLDNFHHDLTGNEFDTLLEDLSLPSMIEEEYSTYEYDELSEEEAYSAYEHDEMSEEQPEDKNDIQDVNAVDTTVETPDIVGLDENVGVVDGIQRPAIEYPFLADDEYDDCTSVEDWSDYSDIDLGYNAPKESDTSGIMDGGTQSDHNIDSSGKLIHLGKTTIVESQGAVKYGFAAFASYDYLVAFNPLLAHDSEHRKTSDSKMNPRVSRYSFASQDPESVLGSADRIGTPQDGVQQSMNAETKARDSPSFVPHMLGGLSQIVRPPETENHEGSIVQRHHEWQNAMIPESSDEKIVTPGNAETSGRAYTVTNALAPKEDISGGFHPMKRIGAAGLPPPPPVEHAAGTMELCPRSPPVPPCSRSEEYSTKFTERMSQTSGSKAPFWDASELRYKPRVVSFKLSAEIPPPPPRVRDAPANHCWGTRKIDVVDEYQMTSDGSDEELDDTEMMLLVETEVVDGDQFDHVDAGYEEEDDMDEDDWRMLQTSNWSPQQNGEDSAETEKWIFDEDGSDDEEGLSSIDDMTDFGDGDEVAVQAERESAEDSEPSSDEIAEKMFLGNSAVSNLPGSSSHVPPSFSSGFPANPWQQAESEGPSRRDQKNHYLGAPPIAKLPPPPPPL